MRRVIGRVALLGLLVSSVADADEGLPPVEPVEPARVWLFDLTVQTEIGLYKGEAGNPVSVAPDLSLVTRGVPQLEVVHSSAAITGFHGMLLGTSLCVSGSLCDLYQPSVYHDGGIQLTQTIRSHAAGDDGFNQTALSVTGGVIANNYDPFALALKLGVRGSFLSTSSIQLQIVPNVHVALAERETQEDRLFVPVTVAMLPSEQVTLQLETGIAAPFDGFADNLQVPLGVNVGIAGGSGIDLVASFTFPAIYGGDAVVVSGRDARVLTVGLRWSKLLGGERD